MRRVAAIALTLAFVVSAPAAHAQASSSNLVIAVLLRAAGDDAISACQGSKIQDPKALEQVLIQAFSPTGSFSGDDTCVTFHADQPLTHRAFGNARAFRITPNLQSALANSYKDVSLIVCTPLLTDSIRVFTGPKPSVTNHCRFGGYEWDALQPLDVQITFDATSRDVERGILGVIAWILAIGTLVGFAVQRSRPLLPRNSVLSALVIVFFSGLALDGWVQVAYFSHLLHSLQLTAHIGESGGAALIAIPATISAIAVAFSGMRFTRGHAIDASVESRAPALGSGLPEPAPTSLPASDTIMPFALRPARPQNLWVTLIPPVAFFIAYVMFVAYLGGTEIKVEGMIATVFVYAFASRFFAHGLLPFLHAARPIDAERRDAIVAKLRELGAPQRNILVSPLPPAASPFGGSILCVGDRATIWEPMLSLGDQELAGAIALRSAHVRGWPTSLAFLVATLAIAIPARSDGHVPLFAIAVPVAVLVAMGFQDIVSNIRVRDRVARSSQAESLIRGSLTAARTTARLAAAGSLGVFGIKAPAYAAGTWVRALKQAGAIAREAGLPASSVAHIADQVRRAELHPTGEHVLSALQPRP